jgi:hypothetical protein
LDPVTYQASYHGEYVPPPVVREWRCAGQPGPLGDRRIKPEAQA